MNLDDSNQDSPKVPSAIQFASNDVNWGNFADKSAANTIEWFKLLLVDEDDLPEEIRTSGPVMEARDRLRELDIICEDIIARYLDELWSNCLQKVKTEVGAATVDRSRFHVVVTLPAICKSKSICCSRAPESGGYIQSHPIEESSADGIQGRTIHVRECSRR